MAALGFDRRGRRLTPGRSHTISHPQQRFLAMLIREAFRNGWTYAEVGCLDDNHLESMSMNAASDAISRLKAAKERGWTKESK